MTSSNPKDLSVPKFAANLTMMFNEVPFIERFEAAANQKP